MHKAPYVFPIIGGRKVEHLQANIEALSISLTEEQIKYLEGILTFDKGFPSSLIVRFDDFFYMLGPFGLTRWECFLGRVRYLSLVVHVLCALRYSTTPAAYCPYLQLIATGNLSGSLRTKTLHRV